MCDNCSAVVGELNRQTYRLRVMLFLERRGYKTSNLNTQALQLIASEYNNKVSAVECAMHLTFHENTGLERPHENHFVNS